MAKTLKVETLQKNIIAALQARIDNAPNENQKDNLIAEQKQFEGKAGAHVLESLQALQINMQELFANIAICESRNSEFIAVYALQKIRKAAFALAHKQTSYFDKYTFSIVKNLNQLQALDNLNTQRAICSKIELDALATEQAVKQYWNCNPSTASTQASSTRMMLKHLQICNVRKGAKGDSISFADSSSAQLVQELFA